MTFKDTGRSTGHTPSSLGKLLSRNNFSLIELLVAISIIGVLCSLLLPVLGKARAAGRQIQCLGNIRQFGVASSYYYNDYGYILPYAYPQLLYYGQPRTCWWEMLNPYLENINAHTNPFPGSLYTGPAAVPNWYIVSKYACPEVSKETASTVPFTANKATIGVSCFYTPASDYERCIRGNFKQPSRLMMLGDAYEVDINLKTLTGAMEEIRMGHGNGANLLYHDLHAGKRMRGTFSSTQATPFWDPRPAYENLDD